MSWLSDLKRELQKFGEPMKPRAERRPAAGLSALYGPDSATTPAGIKDISSTGVYLFTEKRLRTGELVTLILREESEPESSTELQFSVHALVAREGEDGIGLAFVLPAGLNLDLWGVLVRNIVVLTDREQVADMFRTLRTILFLCRICQTEAEEPILLLGKDLHPDRTASLIKISLEAENLLASRPDADRMRAHPKLVTNILRDGSWASDQASIRLWAGLLSSSCSVVGADDCNQIFVDLLVHVSPVEAKLFIHGCERTLGIAPGHENSARDSIVLNAKEMIELTGVYDLSRVSTELAYLFNLGLVKKVCDLGSYHDDVTSFDITPSELGIELYKHCYGSREKMDPRLIEDASSHLASFFPQPQTEDFDSPAPPSLLPSSEN
jgi:hypothetical protein